MCSRVLGRAVPDPGHVLSGAPFLVFCKTEPDHGPALSADQILVLEYGELVERGRHAELLARNGRYKQLYDKQYQIERDQFINPGEDFTAPKPL